MNKWIWLVILLFSISCVPVQQETVYTPVTIVEQKAQPIITTTEEIPVTKLYIKDVRVDVKETSATLSFKTTVDSKGYAELIQGEKVFYQLNLSNPAKEHTLMFGALRNGLDYTIRLVMNNVKHDIKIGYYSDQFDSAVLHFVASNSYSTEYSNQYSSWDISGYTYPGKYDGSPSPCANGCRQ